ncbi:MAG: NAD(P)-dependent oxidoreductase [Anaerolineales bacterium]|nr:NAD(P)-dependent oxidoreductase [Anaerolineales bacterium]MCZ2290308.1 NAD(P)-dependent oxidoreductase [Anaerolineales bacterium]
MTRHAVITGGAGYIGSLLTSELLRAGWRVTVLDSLLFGGESLVPFLSHPSFHFVKADVTDPRAVKDSLKGDWAKPEAVIHLAAIVGFPACQAVGKQAAWKYNVEATKMVFEQASALGAERFVFASSYSNYGLSPDGKPVTEESPLNPQSLYAETKIAAEEYLLGQKDAPAAPLLFRLATLYGISPRTRFDLIVNQFVLEAFSKRELIIYQRGYSRSFVHVRDTVRGILLGLDAPEAKTRGQVYNLGADNGNYTKDQIVNLVLVRMPETVVEYKDLTFGGDMRDITVSFEKIRRELGFETALTVDDGIRELVFALKSGLIRNPHDEKYRNAQFIVQ